MPTAVTNGKTKPDLNNAPLEVIRRGAIAASIWKRQTSAGFEYLDFSLSRSWKLKDGHRSGYSQNFFENNAEAIGEVVRQACKFIRDFIAPQPHESNPLELRSAATTTRRRCETRVAPGPRQPRTCGRPPRKLLHEAHEQHFFGALTLFFAQGLTGRDNRCAKLIALLFVCAAFGALLYWVTSP